ncbi:MAG: FKBP-type peptidyl-prolyl cis-trans isomerase [Bacteroidales bacterium]|jgi:FKBP-type peptidyl-prolyl cis-trans isomerase|nr:FKBP-type peptidyl-prolyl cis-trans isomerase [Bacteroidales bacterium]
MLVRLLVIALLSLVTVSCNSGHEKTGAQKRPGKKELAELNRYMVAKDRERIENYIARKDLKMTETQSGLWYMIKLEGKGNFFTDNDRVTMEYDCNTLDGTYCYSSKESGPKEVIVGRTRIEPGLDQGLRFLKPGGEAIFIIPPFLGWGLPGDGGKIPSRAVLVYNIKVIDNK